MSKSIFHFKQFKVDQHGSAMKINTDGVLLAARAQANSPARVLDIGTGTGVIGLMLAQRFPNAVIDALEIHEEAAACAKKNFVESPFFERLTVFETAFQDFKPNQCYDLIVSNPPFFINSLPNPNGAKSIARHVKEDFFEQLFTRTYEWLSEIGSFQLIVPLSILDFAKDKGFLDHWTIQNEIHIRSFNASEVIRVILTLSKESRSVETENFVIYQEKGVYTMEYKNLLQPFFLNF